MSLVVAQESGPAGGGGRELSVVVQGGLGLHNLVGVASSCRHWRESLPEAQIVLAVSSCDDILLERDGDRILDLHPDPARTGASLLAAACRELLRCCDVVVLAADALPLGPIKTDSPAPNHANLQIAAAQRGLAAATRRYALRVRSDMVFVGPGLFEQWEALAPLPRGARALFQERVLVSNLYTLNPYTFERLPFHVSDWFHLGLLEDIASIWDVPPIAYADSVHYQVHPHPPPSNLDERKFNLRLAVEQHICFNVFHRGFPDLRLDHLIDWRSREAWLDILADNFVIGDLPAAGCIFPKYGHDLLNPRKDIHCISQADWRALVDAADRPAVLRRRRMQARRPEGEAFPRRYPVAILSTAVGERLPRRIASSWREGVLLYGPYDVLPRGEYLARLCVDTVEGPGAIELRAVSDKGNRELGRRRIEVRTGERPDVTCRFRVDADRIEIETVASVHGLPAVVTSGTVVERLQEVVQAPSFWEGQHSAVGEVRDGALSTTGRGGLLLFGPYVSLPSGRYRLEVETSAADDAGAGAGVMVEAARDFGVRLAARRVSHGELASGGFGLDFEFEAPAGNVEMRLRVGRAARFGVVNVRLFACVDRAAPPEDFEPRTGGAATAAASTAAEPPATRRPPPPHRPREGAPSGRAEPA